MLRAKMFRPLLRALREGKQIEIDLHDGDAWEAVAGFAAREHARVIGSDELYVRTALAGPQPDRFCCLAGVSVDVRGRETEHREVVDDPRGRQSGERMAHAARAQALAEASRHVHAVAAAEMPEHDVVPVEA